MKIFYWIFYAFVHNLVVNCDAAKILGVFPTGGQSHFIIAHALMKGLAERGHEVTVINAFPQEIPIKNYRDVVNVAIRDGLNETLDNLHEMKNQSVFASLIQLYGFGVFLTNLTLNEANVQKLIKSEEKFDLIVMEVFLNEAQVGFGHIFNAPIVGLGPFGASSWICDTVGAPSPLSYVPHPFLELSDRMDFAERLWNFIIAGFEHFYRYYIYLPQQEKIYNSIFPDPKPPMWEIYKKFSLALLNSHFSLSYPRPLMPNMIEVGGMHIKRTTDPLPSDLNKFLDSAVDGAIFFSMGSNIKSKNLHLDKINAILKVFSSLKQKVLWKWEKNDLPGKSDNIFISPWFPQADILAHPNLKLFITHGGLLSTTEAVFHAVPVLGIPFFGDQYLNIRRVSAVGVGLSLDYNELNEENFARNIREILENPSYSEKAKEISLAYRDQPQTPLDTAIYWVEYILKHNGAPHMRSAGQDLSLLKYNNLDVYAFLISIIIFISYVFLAICSRFFCNRKVDQIVVKRSKKVN